ncbi:MULTISPECIES: hypothetical protein [Stenotrophomonas]|nr:MULTISPECIES: hypothetical protein [Stenotrophomonas]
MRLLLEHNRRGWMTPAARANRKQSLREALQFMSSNMGWCVRAVIQG